MKEFIIAAVSEIQPGQRKDVSIDGKSILVLNVSGNLYQSTTSVGTGDAICPEASSGAR
jgi:hypothetical protein